MEHEVEGGTRIVDNNSRAVLEQRRAQHRIGTHEFLFLVGNRFLYSRAFVVLYILMILANFSMLLWISLSANYDQTLSSPVFFVLEIIIALLLGLEVGVKLISQKRLFWKKCSNIFDAFLFLLCFISLAISLFGASKFEQIDETLARALLVVRYVIQFIRLCSFIQSRQKIGQLLSGPHHGVDDIDFSALEREHQQGLGNRSLSSPSLGIGAESGAILSSDMSPGTSSISTTPRASRENMVVEMDRHGRESPPTTPPKNTSMYDGEVWFEKDEER